MNTRSRNFCFTQNNYTDVSYTSLEDLSYKYLILGKEKGEEGTPHLQGFIVFKHAKKLKEAIIKLAGCHVSLCKGTPLQNIVYCSKGDDFKEFGDRPKVPKAKGDLVKLLYADALALAKEGRIDEITPSIQLRCYNQLKRVEKDNLKPLAVVRKIKVFWGETATGKSHMAWEQATFDAYPKIPTTKFWDGYDKQENVVIDEFRGKIAIEHLLVWCDKYPCIIENKGGATVLYAKNIWITSNLHPKQWYPDVDSETVDALLRRLDIYECQVEKTLGVSGELITNYKYNKNK